MCAPLVIVGTGLAGYTLAREWRKLDRSTPLVMISRDAAGFYSKPMLSNALAGGKTPAALVMKSAEQMAQDLQAEIHPLTEVVALDAENRSLTLRPRGQGLEGAEPGAALAGPPSGLNYGRLVLALGADPIRLPLAGEAASRVRSVNDLDDFAAFLRDIEGAQRVAILGAGLIGCEFANDLLARGIEPTVIDPAPAPLGRLLPPAAAAFLQRRLQAAGVKFVHGASLERVEPGAGNALDLLLTDASRLQVDALLSAVGLRPRVELARAAGLMTARGILTDRLLQTTAEGVYAVGDALEIQDGAQGHVLPFVMPLMQQARALASTLAGTPTPVVYPAMPVTVKTPACPTVVCPPAAALTVSWSGEEDEQGAGFTALAHDAQGALQGFALLGSATSRKQELARTLPPMMGG